jgi:hypothetical protein
MADTPGGAQALRTTGSRWRELLVAVLLLASALAGCGDGRDGADVEPMTSANGPSSVTTSAAPTTAADAKVAVERAYRAFWDDVVAVGRTADWQSPRLAEHATGAALAQLRAQFREVKAQGWIAKGTVKVSPVVVSVSRTKATVRDCVDTTRYGRFDPKTNRWIDPPGGQPDAERFELVFDNGWKVADTVVTGQCAG